MDHIGIYLRKIYFRKLTGQLLFKEGSVQKNLYFQKGDLVFAKTNVPEERLGEILFKLGKISDEAYAQIDRYTEPQKEIGKTIVEKGMTSQRNVNDGVTYQMKEIVASIFPRFEGKINFQENPALDHRVFEAKLNVPYLIEDGIRRMKFHPSLQKFLEKKVPFLKARIFHHLLTEEEKQLLDKVKGEANAQSLWNSLRINPEFFWKSLYLYYCLNLIDFKDKEEIPEEIKEEEIREGLRPDLEKQIEEILSFKERLPSLNYYQILNVSREASEEDIKKAYFILARKFHPDRFDRSLSEKYGDIVDEIFDKITKAYRVLSSREERRQYDDKGPMVATREDTRDWAKKADLKFRQARTLYNQARYEEALILLEESVRLNRNKGDYFLLLALTEAKIPLLRKKAEEHFLRAIELEPWNAEGYVGLGILYKQEGLSTKATKQFQKALEIDADHDVAMRQLEAMGVGKKEGKLKSLLSMNIFGSKKK